MSDAVPVRHVLIVSSWSVQLLDFLQIRQGLEAEIGRFPEARRPIIHWEFLASDAVGDPRAIAPQWAAAIQARYASLDLDAIITDGAPAARLLLSNPELLPRAPLFISAPLGLEATLEVPIRPFTLIPEVNEMTRSLSTITQILPHVQRVVAITDDSPQGARLAAQIRDASEQLGRHPAVEVWEHQTEDEVYAAAQQLDSDTAVLYLSRLRNWPRFTEFARDDQRARGLSKLVDVATVPVFPYYESSLTLGGVGGYMRSTEQRGRLLGRIAVEGLAAIPQSPAAVGQASYVSVFDDRELKRWQIPDDRLPPGSKILHRVPSFWSSHADIVFAASIVFVIESLLILGLIRLNRQRKAALGLLDQERASLEIRVLARTSELARANEQLASLSVTDGLTGILNRRRFDELCAREWENAVQGHQPLAIAMIDVDWFKHYNDEYGHQMGDDCLKKIAQIMNSITRRHNDLAARFGGEEFVILAPLTDLFEMRAIAQSFMDALSTLHIPHVRSPFEQVTVSMGLAEFVPGSKDTVDQLIKRADQALYRAKAHGRNRVDE